MCPDQHRFTIRHVTQYYRQVFQRIYVALVGYGGEFGISGGYFSFRYPVDQLFMTEAIGNQVRHADNFQIKFFCDEFELRKAGHGAVFIHYLA